MRHTRNRTRVCEENVMATLLLGWTSASFFTRWFVSDTILFSEERTVPWWRNEDLAVCDSLRLLRLAQPFAHGTGFGL